MCVVRMSALSLSGCHTTTGCYSILQCCKSVIVGYELDLLRHQAGNATGINFGLFAPHWQSNYAVPLGDVFKLGLMYF